MSIIKSWIVDPKSIEQGWFGDHERGPFFLSAMGQDPENQLNYKTCYFYPDRNIWRPELNLEGDCTPFVRFLTDLPEGIGITPDIDLSHIDDALMAVAQAVQNRASI